MDAALLGLIVPVAVALGGGVGWWLGRKRQAAQDAVDILKEKKTLIEGLLSDSAGTDREQGIHTQLDDVNHALLGLLGRRLQRTLQDAGLPTEEILIANGRTQVSREQAARIERAAEEVSALPPPLPVDLMYALGGTYYYAGRYEDARRVFDRILDLIPDNSVALNNRGITYDSMGRYEEAFEDYNRSLELTPNHAVILANRAYAYYHMERYEEALADYNRSLELRPDSAHVLNDRGATYNQMGRYDEALADYNRSLDVRADDPTTLTNRGVVYCTLGMYHEALADHNRSLELRPDVWLTLNNRAVTYRKLGRYDEAIADHNRALELMPDHSAILATRGATYVHMGRYEEALADYKRSVEVRPDHPETLYNTARLLSLRREGGDAVGYLDKAIAGNETYRETARTDNYFDNIRDDPRFKKLVEPE